MSKFFVLPKKSLLCTVVLFAGFSLSLNAQRNNNPVQNFTENEMLPINNGDSISNDELILPFMNVKKRNATSGSNVIKGEDLEKYPTVDIRNSFSGLTSGLRVRETNGSPDIHSEETYGSFGFMEKVQFYLRGRSPLFIIDDIPTKVTEVQIEPYEIESVTIIKDIVGKTMFGPEAADGIIFIRTKRGISDRNILRVNVETGLNVIDRFPRWVNGADYATLNNMARENNRLNPLYSNSDIGAYAKNNPYDMYHPSSDFRNMILKNTMNLRKVNFSYEGRKDKVSFFTYLGYSGSDDIMKIGHKANYNRLNARSNIDIKLNDLLSVHFNIFGGLTFRNSPQYSTGDLTKFNVLMSDITTISPIAFPVYASTTADDKFIWYGVDPLFQQNPIGAMEGSGYYTEYGRSGTTNLALEYDMKHLVKGLKSKTFFSFDVFNLVRLGKVEQYAAYNVIPSKTTSGSDTILLTKSKDGATVPNISNMHDYYYQRFGGYQSFTYDKDLGNNSWLNAALTYYISMTTRDVVLQPERQQNMILSAFYTHHGKYSLHGALNYAGSMSLRPGNKYALFPSVGASWIISDEYIFSNISFIDFLKLRSEIGILGYESYSYNYLYEDNWYYTASGSSTGPAPTGYWFGSDTESTKRSYPNRIGNPNFGREKRKEFSIGTEVILFKNKLAVEVNYYNNIREDIVTNLSNVIPYVSGTADYSIDNYNKARYYGMEAALQYTNNTGNFAYSFGGNLTIQNSKWLKYDQPNYRFDYQSRIGKATDSYWGLTYLGKFTTDGESEIIPQLFDEKLNIGDLKYADLNGDGIVDDNDRSVIGHTSPRLYYALNLKMSYKRFDLSLIADGIAFVDLAQTNHFFHNGWGDNNYSEFVRDNIGSLYPRLTYYQISNNFQPSNFWLTNGGYCKLQNVELAYNLSTELANKLYIQGARIFLRGANLLTITNVKYVDPESPDAGVITYPLFKTYSCGIKFTF